MFPAFRREHRKYRSLHQNHTVVSGQLEPFGGCSVEEVLKAISVGSQVGLTAEGHIVPVADFQPDEVSLPIDPSGILSQPYHFEMWFSADRAHPWVYVVDPMISAFLHPNHPHMYLATHPDWPRFFAPNRICFYPPHHELWDSKKDSLYPLVVWLSAFLASHAAWEASGKWIGAETSHQAGDIWRAYRQNECHCGSGLPMVECHPYPFRMRGVI